MQQHDQSVFQKVTAKKGSKSFWNTTKPFFTNRGIITNDSIILEENRVLKNNRKETTEIFDNYYTNTAETTSGKQPSAISNPNSECQYKAIVKKITESYKNHPSVVIIKENIFPCSLSFDLPQASKKDINKIVKSFDANKITGPDGIPLKLIKLSANVVEKYFTSIINHNISRSYLSDGANNALIRTIYKKRDRENKENYHPVSILNGFSKVYERFINDSMLLIIKTFLSNFVLASRKHYSANHVLITLIENWKKNLHNNKILGAVFIDLSKAFDCIPHDLLIAKMKAYGIGDYFLTFCNLYLKHRKQSMNINNAHSMFQILLSGVPQESILRPLLLNIFINDLFIS